MAKTTKKTAKKSPKKTVKKAATKKAVKKKPVKKAPAKKKPAKKAPAKKKPAKKAVKKAVKKATKKAVKKKAPVKKAADRSSGERVVSKSSVKKTRLQRKKVVAQTKRLIEEARQAALPKVKKYKPNKKTRYTKAELEHFRKIIIEERNKIIESAKANMQSLVDDESNYVGDNQTYSSHMAEQGSDEMEREKNYMFVQRDEKYLGYLQEALIRIDQGTYGVCIDCFETPHNLCRTCPLIDGERLELVPITQHCIECKNIRG